MTITLELTHRQFEVILQLVRHAILTNPIEEVDIEEIERLNEVLSEYSFNNKEKPSKE